MLKKFTDWWKQKPNAEPMEAFDYVIEYSSPKNTSIQPEEDFKYETTLKRDLTKIVNMFNNDQLEGIVNGITVDKENNKVYLRTEGLSIEFVREMIELKTLSIDTEYFRMLNYSFLDNRSTEKYQWIASYSEYKSVYEKPVKTYAKQEIIPLLELIKQNFNNKAYNYIFCKYEDSIHIVVNAFKDSIEHSGEVTEEVLEKSKVIINKLKLSLEEKQKEIELIEQMQKEAVAKSIANRLDNEIKFIDEYLEIN